MFHDLRRRAVHGSVAGMSVEDVDSAGRITSQLISHIDPVARWGHNRAVSVPVWSPRTVIERPHLDWISGICDVDNAQPAIPEADVIEHAAAPGMAANHGLVGQILIHTRERRTVQPFRRDKPTQDLARENVHRVHPTIDDAMRVAVGVRATALDLRVELRALEPTPARHRNPAEKNRVERIDGRVIQADADEGVSP